MLLSVKFDVKYMIINVLYEINLFIIKSVHSRIKVCSLSVLQRNYTRKRKLLNGKIDQYIRNKN